MPESNTRNYLDKATKLNSDYLERIAIHFKSVNLSWLIAGEGEPFIGDAPTGSSNVTGSNNTTATGKNIHINERSLTIDECTRNLSDCRTELDKAQAEVQALRVQLTSKDEVIAAKNDLIAMQAENLSLLRGGFTRPN